MTIPPWAAGLYNQRRKDLVNLDDEVGGLPVPHSATESILRQLVKKGLVERPIQPLNGLGTGRITAYGIDVVQGTTRPPLSGEPIEAHPVSS
jgi:hypothetical protein